MKKWLTFGTPLLCAVVAAAALRRFQRLAEFEDTGLLAPGLYTLCLVALLALAAVGFFLLSRRLLPLGGRREQDGTAFSGYLRSFALPHRAMLLVYLLSGGLLVAAGLLGVREIKMGLAVTNLSYRVLAVALVPTGLDLALVGWLNAQRQEEQGRFAWPLLIPGWCGCVWVISAYQSHTAQPGIMAYAPYLLGAVCAVGACYMIASFSFERPRPYWTAWLCAMALILLGTAVVDAVVLDDVRQLLVCLGYMLYLAAQFKCLLYRAQVPARLEPWAPAEEEVKTEVSDHE